MAARMKAKFDKYWGSIEKMNLIIFLAVVLDPRFKLRYVEFAIRDMYEGTNGATLAHLVRLTCFEMFQDYKVKAGGEIQEEAHIVSNPVVNETSSNVSVHGVRYSMIEKFKKQNYGRVDFDNKTDLDKYLAEDSETMTDKFDILNWWKVNELRFPILSQMARDILSVPISTVASESVFSTGGRVLDAFRSSLSPRIVQALICSQDWIRAKWTTDPINIEENIADIDKFDEDLAKITSESQMSSLGI